MSNDSLGDRMKRYERVSTQSLMPRTPILIRVDGRAFHTFTKGMKRPFDPSIMASMDFAMVQTAKEMAGCVLAYTQSDECSFLLRDDANLDTQAWFGGNRDKIISIAASTFTAYFNSHFHLYNPLETKIATFDARAFSIPIHDAPNYFVWRQHDWERNSLQMLTRSFFTHSDLVNKNRADMHEMLHGIGENWADLSHREKNGAWFCEGRVFSNCIGKYTAFADMINQED